MPEPREEDPDPDLEVAPPSDGEEAFGETGEGTYLGGTVRARKDPMDTLTNEEFDEAYRAVAQSGVQDRDLQESSAPQEDERLRARLRVLCALLIIRPAEGHGTPLKGMRTLRERKEKWMPWIGECVTRLRRRARTGKWSDAQRRELSRFRKEGLPSLTKSITDGSQAAERPRAGMPPEHGQGVEWWGTPRVMPGVRAVGTGPSPAAAIEREYLTAACAREQVEERRIQESHREWKSMGPSPGRGWADQSEAERWKPMEEATIPRESLDRRGGARGSSPETRPGRGRGMVGGTMAPKKKRRAGQASRARREAQRRLVRERKESGVTVLGDRTALSPERAVERAGTLEASSPPVRRPPPLARSEVQEPVVSAGKAEEPRVLTEEEVTKRAAELAYPVRSSEVHHQVFEEAINLSSLDPVSEEVVELWRKGELTAALVLPTPAGRNRFEPTGWTLALGRRGRVAADEEWPSVEPDSLSGRHLYREVPVVLSVLPQAAAARDAGARTRGRAMRARKHREPRSPCMEDDGVGVPRSMLVHSSVTGARRPEMVDVEQAGMERLVKELAVLERSDWYGSVDSLIDALPTTGYEGLTRWGVDVLEPIAQPADPNDPPIGGEGNENVVDDGDYGPQKVVFTGIPKLLWKEPYNGVRPGVVDQFGDSLMPPLEPGDLILPRVGGRSSFRIPVGILRAGWEQMLEARPELSTPPRELTADVGGSRRPRLNSQWGRWEKEYLRALEILILSHWATHGSEKPLGWPRLDASLAGKKG